VLDDNKMLCLANSERIKLTPWIHMCFEVQDLLQASPATVSRCGMVYVDPDDLGWKPLLDSWRNTDVKKKINDAQMTYLCNLFQNHFENCLEIGKKNGSFQIHQVLASKVRLCLELLDSTISQISFPELQKDDPYLLLCKLFAWCVLWSQASNFRDAEKGTFEKLMREQLSKEAFMK